MSLNRSGKKSVLWSSVTALFLLVALAAGVFFVQKSQDTRGRAAPIADPNLMGYWKFDETSGNAAIDSSGQGNHGLLENGATRFVSPKQGDNKLELDGVDERVQVQTTNDTLNNLQDFTVAAWIRPTKTGGTIVRKGNTGLARFNIGINSAGRLYLRSGHTQQGVWWTNESVPLYKWSYITVTYSFSSTDNNPVFYINGVQKDLTKNQTPAGTVVTDTPYMYIGNNHDFVNRSAPGFTGNFSGRMDLVRVYNRILSASEVWHIYKNP